MTVELLPDLVLCVLLLVVAWSALFASWHCLWLSA